MLRAGLVRVAVLTLIMSACSGSASGTDSQTGTSKVQGVDSGHRAPEGKELSHARCAPIAIAPYGQSVRS